MIVVVVVVVVVLVVMVVGVAVGVVVVVVGCRWSFLHQSSLDVIGWKGCLIEGVMTTCLYGYHSYDLLLLLLLLLLQISPQLRHQSIGTAHG